MKGRDGALGDFFSFYSNNSVVCIFYLISGHFTLMYTCIQHLLEPNRRVVLFRDKNDPIEKVNQSTI